MTSSTGRVRSDDPAVREAVGTMFDLVLGHGGQVHPGLWVEEVDGALSVHVDGADDSVLGELPEELLVPVGGVMFDVVDDRLVVATTDPRVTALQGELLAAHLRLYNATGKVPWARTTLPEVALTGTDRDLLQRLRRAERPVPSVAAAFVSTRTLARGTRAAANPADSGKVSADIADSAPDAPSDQPERLVLMPLLDLINHHPLARPFGGSRRSLTVTVSRPSGGTETFVSYGASKSPIDMACRYGFVPDGCRTTRLCPGEVEVDGLVVRVEGRSLQPRSAFDPPIVAIEESTLTLSHLTIDADHPQRLRAALAMALQMAGRSRGAASGDGPAVDVVLARLFRAERSATTAVRNGLTSQAPARQVLERALAVHRAVIDEAAAALGVAI